MERFPRYGDCHERGACRLIGIGIALLDDGKRMRAGTDEILLAVDGRHPEGLAPPHLWILRLHLISNLKFPTWLIMRYYETYDYVSLWIAAY